MKKIRVLIAMMGMDQHEFGAIAISRLLRDAGMEVIYAGRFNVPTMIVKTAMEEDVDIIGLSCYSWEYLYYVPELLHLLEKQQLQIPVIVGGAVITAGDEEALRQQGIAAAFGPTASTGDIVQAIQRLVGAS